MNETKWWETEEGIEWLSQGNANTAWENHLASKTTYHIGMKFIKGNPYNSSKQEYILAHVSARMVCLVGLQDGNCWSDPKKVADPYKITTEEFEPMSSTVSDGYSFLLC